MQSVYFDRIQHFNENARIMNDNNFVKLGDVAHECRLTWSGEQTNIPIVGLEHLIPGEIELSSWDSNIEHTFSKKFTKGQVLLGRRRVYLKKAVVAPCDGICSGDITVIESTGGILPELLPFVIQNDRFFDYAMQGSAGSLSPRVKWEHLKNYEFSLPSLAEQKVLADKLWAAYHLKESYKKLLAATEEMVKSQFIEMFGDFHNKVQIKDVCLVVSGKSIPTKLEDIDGNNPYIKVADFNIPGNEKYITIAQRYVSDDSASYSKQIPEGSVIFAKNGAASMSNKKRLTKIRCCIDMNTMAVFPKNESILSEFLFAAIEAMDVSSHVRQGAIPSISPKSIEDSYIAMPTMEEQYRYVSIAKHADKSGFELRKSVDAIDKVIKSVINEN